MAGSKVDLGINAEVFSETAGMWVCGRVVAPRRNGYIEVHYEYEGMLLRKCTAPDSANLRISAGLISEESDEDVEHDPEVELDFTVIPTDGKNGKLFQITQPSRGLFSCLTAPVEDSSLVCSCFEDMDIVPQRHKTDGSAKGAYGGGGEKLDADSLTAWAATAVGLVALAPKVAVLTSLAAVVGAVLPLLSSFFVKDPTTPCALKQKAQLECNAMKTLLDELQTFETTLIQTDYHVFRKESLRIHNELTEYLQRCDKWCEECVKWFHAWRCMIMVRAGLIDKGWKKGWIKKKEREVMINQLTVQKSRIKLDWLPGEEHMGTFLDRYVDFRVKNLRVTLQKRGSCYTGFGFLVLEDHYTRREIVLKDPKGKAVGYAELPYHILKYLDIVRERASDNVQEVKDAGLDKGTFLSSVKLWRQPKSKNVEDADPDERTRPGRLFGEAQYGGKTVKLATEVEEEGPY